jgi:hypothetical protein
MRVLAEDMPRHPPGLLSCHYQTAQQQAEPREEGEKPAISSPAFASLVVLAFLLWDDSQVVISEISPRLSKEEP